MAEQGYIASGMGAGFVDAAINWPGKVYESTVNTLTHLTDIPGNLVQAGKNGVDWLNSPIPAQSIERAGDQLLFSTPDKLGGIVFDAATGAITAGIGGKAVEWVGGKWVASAAKGTVTAGKEIPATSANARVGLREDLAVQAGIPRSLDKVWGRQ
ncbi:MAG: hypothetical protein MUW57_14345 [Pseudomonas sp.]|nr:hypothetical protein [Pseudomonas sp.]